MLMVPVRSSLPSLKPELKPACFCPISINHSSLEALALVIKALLLRAAFEYGYIIHRHWHSIHASDELKFYAHRYATFVHTLKHNVQYALISYAGKTVYMNVNPVFHLSKFHIHSAYGGIFIN